MGRTCRKYGGEAYTGFCWENLKERDNLQDPGLDVRIMLR